MPVRGIPSQIELRYSPSHSLLTPALLFHYFPISPHFFLQNVEIWQIFLRFLAYLNIFLYLCTRFGCITRSARTYEALISRILSTPISLMEGVRGIHYILKGVYWTLCVMANRNLAIFNIEAATKVAIDAYGYDVYTRPAFLSRRVVISA